MLPQIDSLEYNDKLIREFIKEKQEKLDSQTDQKKDLYENFIEHDKSEFKKVDEVSCILQMYKLKFVKHIILLVVTKILELLIVATIFFCTKETRYYRDIIDYHGLEENYGFFIFVFLALILFQLFST